MITRNAMLKVLAAGSLVIGTALAPVAASAYTPDTDPAHHSTDVNDTDPAHHRPVMVFSASTGEYVLTPIAGFDLNGYRIGTAPGGTTSTVPASYDADPAHHSTDVNDTDPAHHRPYWVLSNGSWRLVPVPGFDLDGNAVKSHAFK